MQYAILNEDGTYKTKVATTGKIQWDENNFCTAEALFKDGKAEQFNVVEFHETEPPTIDPMVESVLFDGGEYVDGKWQYKWKIEPHTQEQIDYLANEVIIKKKAEILDIVSKNLDIFAQTRNYDSIVSACTYVTSSVQKFAEEGSYCVELRSATYLKVQEIFAQIDSEERQLPSGYDEIRSELPVMQWPN